MDIYYNFDLLSITPTRGVTRGVKDIYYNFSLLVITLKRGVTRAENKRSIMDIYYNFSLLTLTPTRGENLFQQLFYSGF